MDTADLHDWEIKEIGVIWDRLQRDWSRKPNDKHTLQEFAKASNDAFLKAGFVVNVVWENTLVINPSTMQAYPIEIEVLGRTPGARGADHAQDGFDHERKRHEVLSANIRNERFYGEKESNKG